MAKRGDRGKKGTSLSRSQQQKACINPESEGQVWLNFFVTTSEINVLLSIIIS